MTRNDLRRWAQSLQNEGRELGDTLMRYADAWDAEVERLRGDAERYRWLKQQYSIHGHYDKRLPTVLDLHSEYWDVVIDAAREGE